MGKKRYTPELIIGMLRETEVGLRHEVSMQARLAGREGQNMSIGKTSL